MDPIEEEDKLPELYSKSSIMIISVITSTVFGAILYSINLYRVNKRQYILFTMAGAILYQLLGARLAAGIATSQEFLVYMGLNFVGGTLILGLWDLQIGRIPHRPRNTLGVFLIILIILLILMGLNYLGVNNLPE